ncbi:uncharacterized protein LOC134829598 [Culicoides brevitarsis]|uniref:uncharacterized protein LOC134829598 n=1 Tax=Culicoides brevitarsis TaxID=469753 RepID=UPI00307B1F0F
MSICVKNLGLIEKQLFKSFQFRAVAYYSRRNNSKSSESPYKYVRRSKDLGVEESHEHVEGGANWELLAPKSNRFYLPNLCGPAYQSNASIIPAPRDCLAELVDFTNKDPKKLHISSTTCPVLLKKSLVELFPAPEVVGPEPLTLISLKSTQDTETAARNFVLAAREICSRIRMNGYWADFMNCFSGKPFYSYSNGKLFKVDERFRGLGMKFDNLHGCVVITGNKSADLDENPEEFRGVIVSNIFPDITQIRGLIDDD